MKIILDCMGGDNPAGAFVLGASLAAAEFGNETVLVGDPAVLDPLLSSYPFPEGKVEVVRADCFLTMDDPPLSVVREKKDSSMSVGLRLLKEGKGDAFVSAGNTGALLAGSTFIVRRIRGIRAALAAILPLAVPTLLVDAGANTVCTPEMLEQFAMMGSVYMEYVFSIGLPRVGLVNNGSEPAKGAPLQKETYKLLEKSGLNFAGNIEGKDIPFGKCDVLVADGFTGNIILKMTEGMGGFFMGELKDLFKKTALTRVSALGVMRDLKTLKKRFDPSEYGGAPLLGLSRPVIKAHGNSDEKAVKNAIRQAIAYAETGVILQIARKTENLIVSPPPGDSAGSGPNA